MSKALAVASFGLFMFASGILMSRPSNQVYARRLRFWSVVVIVACFIYSIWIA